MTKSQLILNYKNKMRSGTWAPVTGEKCMISVNLSELLIMVISFNCKKKSDEVNYLPSSHRESLSDCLLGAEIPTVPAQ